MRSELLHHDLLLAQLEQLIADRFQFSAIAMREIPPDEPLIGGLLGFDDLDALELGSYVEEEFGITMDGAAESRAALTSMASLAEYIRRRAPPPAAAVASDRRLPSPLWSTRSTGDPSGRLRFSAAVVHL